MTTDNQELVWQRHPLWLPPGAAEIERDMAMHGGSPEESVVRLWRLREQVIAAEKADPFRYAYEPPIWQVCRALLGLPCYDVPFIEHIQARFGWTWGQWCAALRAHLGFAEPVRVLLILGGSRSGKSNFSAKVCQEQMTYVQNSAVYPCHFTEARSIAEQQELFWRYMPAEFKQTQRTEETYVAYKRKTGFSEMGFINPVGSACYFKTYEVEVEKAMEGVSANIIAPDEAVPHDWFPTMETRILERHGCIITTFTPYHGYSPTVKMFGDGAVVARESIGYLLPKDGGEPDRARCLGLTQAEYAEVVLAERQKRAARAPESRPEDVCAWLENTDRTDKECYRPFGFGQAQMPEPAGRAFERVPRVWRCANPRYACVFFHSADNPYGNPKDAIETQIQKSAEVVRERVYGIAAKLHSAKFNRFARKVHVLPDAAMPGPQGGTHFMFCDPHPEKNLFMAWITDTPAASYYRREWPGNYHIPTVGVPGPWAVPSGKNNGHNDGKPGDAQKSFDFGLLRYKFEIARLEGWEDWKRWAQDVQAGPDMVPDFDVIAEWLERNGADWPMHLRMIDSRAANSPRLENDRPVTLQSDFADIGLFFELAPGKDVDVGVKLVQNALDWQEEGDQAGKDRRGWFNAPKLYFAESCVNGIFAMECWTNAEKDRGACKEPIDILRWFYTADLRHANATEPRASGGVSFGQGGSAAPRGQTGYERRQAGGVPGCIQRARARVR